MSKRKPRIKLIDDIDVPEGTEGTVVINDYERLSSRNSLKHFIYSLLSKFILKNDGTIDTDRINKYTDDTQMLIWESAFVSMFVDPNNNYEALESLGDSILSAAFTSYLFDRYTNLDPEQITIMNSEYMSKSYQIVMSDRLGFRKYIKFLEFREDMLEDVFESFTGALYTIGSKVETIGKAYTVVYNFVVYLFKDVKIEINRLKSPKTYVVQSFKMAKIDEFVATETKHKAQNTFKFTLTVNPKGIKQFKELGFTMPSVLAETDFGPKEVVEKQAYEAAYYKLLDVGLTPDNIEQIKSIQEFSDPRYDSDNVKKAKEKALSMGFHRLYFKQPEKKDKDYSQILLLMGENPERIKKIFLYEKVTPHTQITPVKVRMINEFIKM